jgi:N-acetylgalactosamine kinase
MHAPAFAAASASQAVDVGKHNWGNYFLAAYKGVFEHLAAQGQAAPGPLGLQIMIHGTVPTGACCARCAALPVLCWQSCA